LTETIVVEPVLLDGVTLERNLAVLGERQTREGCAFVTADKKSKPGSPQHWARPVLVEIDFAEARRLLQHFDRRWVTDRQKTLKAEALERGWWAPKGLNDEWPMNSWEQHYERKLRAAKPPQSVTELLNDVDRRLIALAQTWEIKTPSLSQLTDEWRILLLNELKARVANVATRLVEDAIFNPPPPLKQKGKPPGAWTEESKLSQDEAVVKRRDRRRSKAQPDIER
jgi:hypothetical protein